MINRFTPARAALVLAVAGALSLTACGSGSGKDTSSAPPPPSENTNPVTITFMEAMSSGAQKDALAKMTQDFHAKYPNITVNLEEQPNYGALQTKINAETAAGKPPTIAQVYGNWADELSAAGSIVPLDGYVAKSDQYKKFYKGIQADLKLADGKTWMWPFNKSVVVMYYNSQMVSSAPKTWDEFAETAKKVSKDGVVALSIDPGNATAPAGGTSFFEILAQSYGDPVFADDGTPQFDKDSSVKALKYLVQMKKDGSLALGTNYPGQVALGAQKGAFDISSVASYPFNLKAVGGKFPMGVAGLPKGDKAANQLAGTNIALFAKATDDEKAAAWKYMQFLTSPEEMAYWSSQTGYLPTSSDVFDQQVMKDYVAKSAFVKDAAGQLDDAKSLPPKSWVNKCSGYLSTAIQNAVNNGADPADELKKAQDAAMKAMKESK